MANSWLLLAAEIDLQPHSWNGAFAWIVELTCTYVAQSSLFLLFAWGAVPVLQRCWRQSRRSSPSMVETVWKLAATLPLLTAPLCVCLGSSLCTWQWPLVAEQPLMSMLPVDEPETAIREQVHRTFPATDQMKAQSAESSIVVADELAPDLRVLSPGNITNRGDSMSLESGNEPATASADDPAIVHVPPISVAPPSEQFDLPSQSSLDEPMGANAAPMHPSRAETTSTARGDDVSQPSMPVVAWLGVLIMTWFAVSLTRLCWKGCALWRWLKRCQPIDGDLRRTLDELTSVGHKIRLVRPPERPAVAVTTTQLQPDEITHLEKRPVTGDQPFACGLWQWTIVLPFGIEERLSPAEMQALLSHEVAHLVRRDPWWQWIGELLCTCLAVQPLNFLARRRWQQATELLCDDWAVEHSTAPTILASCLTRIAEWRLERSSNFGGAAHIVLPAVGRAGSLTQRIEWLLRTSRPAETKRPRARLAATLATFAAGLLIGMYGPRLALITPVEAAPVGQSQDDSTWDAIDQELSETLNELTRLRSQLQAAPDAEATALADEMLGRITTLKEELAR